MPSTSAATGGGHSCRTTRCSSPRTGRVAGILPSEIFREESWATGELVEVVDGCSRRYYKSNIFAVSVAVSVVMVVASAVAVAVAISVLGLLVLLALSDPPVAY